MNFSAMPAKFSITIFNVLTITLKKKNMRSHHCHGPNDLSILLNGTAILTEHHNKLQFKIVQTFMKETKRFTSN